MTISPLRLEQQVSTHVGCVRSANEDSILGRSQAALWVVADGMGGHKNGQRASQEVIHSLESLDVPEDFDEACSAVAEAIHGANARLFAENRESSEHMGTTVVALVIRGRRFAVLWAGDSRAYLFRNQSAYRLTKDHSQVQEMVDRGLLTPEQASGHPMGHVLARAVGVEEFLELDAITDEVLPGDMFLLCSDGLHGVVKDGELVEALAPGQADGADRLVEMCLARGAPDNVSVAIVTASEPTSLSFVTNPGMASQ